MKGGIFVADLDDHALTVISAEIAAGSPIVRAMGNFLFFILTDTPSLLENQSKECWNKIIYPDMKATIYLSYFKVKNNINSLIEDAYQMPMKHVNRAIEIQEKTYYDEKNKTFGSLFRVEGNAASQLQFFLSLLSMQVTL